MDFSIVGISAGAGPHKGVLNVLRRDVHASLTGVRKRQQVGYQYALSKRTELQAFADHGGVESSKVGVRVRAVGAGMWHDF